MTDQEVLSQKLTEYRTNESKRAIINIEADLKKYEEKYGLTKPHSPKLSHNAPGQLSGISK